MAWYCRKVVTDERISGIEPWERKWERIWNGRAAVRVLTIIGAGCAIWSNICLPLPGVSVAILGAMAVIMSIGPRMRWPEKTAWMVLIFAMLLAEIHSIRFDRATNDAAQEKIRDAENKKFDTIAQGLKDSIDVSKAQYGSTIDHVNRVLDKTQQAADLAKESVENITGGKAYLVLTQLMPLPEKVNPQLSWTAFILGNRTVWDVQVQEFEEPNQPQGWPNRTINLGPVSSKWSQNLLSESMPSRDKVNVYHFTVMSRNMITTEEVKLRFDPSMNEWEGRWKVEGLASSPFTKNTLLEEIDWHRLIHAIRIQP